MTGVVIRKQEIRQWLTAVSHLAFTRDSRAQGFATPLSAFSCDAEKAASVVREIAPRVDLVQS